MMRIWLLAIQSITLYNDSWIILSFQRIHDTSAPNEVCFVTLLHHTFFKTITATSYHNHLIFMQALYWWAVFWDYRRLVTTSYFNYILKLVCLGINNFCSIFQIYIAVFSVQHGDAFRLVYGYDSFGNTCDEDNSDRAIPNMTLTGLNLKGQP